MSRFQTITMLFFDLKTILLWIFVDEKSLLTGDFDVRIYFLCGDFVDLFNYCERIKGVKDEEIEAFNVSIGVN